MTSFLRMLTLLRVAAKYRLLELAPPSSQRQLAAALVNLCGLGCKKCSVDMPRGDRLRLALQELGPIFIKLGQIVSTRRDMLDDDIADALAMLQDQVAPFSGEKAREILEHELHRPVEECFASFDISPLASASVAQVHAVTLQNGTDAVVKIIRPNLETTIDHDIKLLSRLASLLEAIVSDSRRLRLHELISDYDRIIHAELDLKQEASNGSLLKSNFSSEPLNELMTVPQIYWDYSTENILVMQRMYGVPVSDIDTLKEKQVNLHLLATRGVEIFFTQVFEQNFFHADMHPGNIFIDISEPDNPKYITLDCAIMGTLSDTDRYYVARILLGALNRDYHQVAKLYIDAGWLSTDVPLAAFENLIRGVCEPIFSKPISEIGFGNLLVYLFKAAQRFGMEVQPSLVLLQKTLVNIEGLGQRLYPELDLWETAQPFLDRWVEANYSANGASAALKQKIPELLQAMPVLPQRATVQLRKFLNEVGVTPSSGLQQQVEELKAQLYRQRRIHQVVGLIAVIWLVNHWLNH